MSVRAIGSLSGTSSVNDATTELQRAQQKLAADLAARAAAAKVLAEDRDAVARAQQAAEAAKAAAAARQKEQAPLLPSSSTRPITASASALGGSFDVIV